MNNAQIARNAPEGATHYALIGGKVDYYRPSKHPFGDKWDLHIISGQWRSQFERIHGYLSPIQIKPHYTAAQVVRGEHLNKGVNSK